MDPPVEHYMTLYRSLAHLATQWPYRNDDDWILEVEASLVRTRHDPT